MRTGTWPLGRSRGSSFNVTRLVSRCQTRRLGPAPPAQPPDRGETAGPEGWSPSRPVDLASGVRGENYVRRAVGAESNPLPSLSRTAVRWHSRLASVAPVEPAGAPAVEHEPGRGDPTSTVTSPALVRHEPAPTGGRHERPRVRARSRRRSCSRRRVRRSDARHRSGVPASETNIRPVALPRAAATGCSLRRAPDRRSLGSRRCPLPTLHAALAVPLGCSLRRAPSAVGRSGGTDRH
jgi:hypothetical protein